MRGDAPDDLGRDAELSESHATDVLSAFEEAFPGDTGRMRSPVRRIRELAPAIVAFVVVVGVWEALTVALDVESFVLPRPSAIIERFFATWNEIWGAGWNTLVESLGGLVAGTVLGVGVALATVRWTLVREGLMPFAIAANSVPIIALAPIANAWFSITSPISKMVVVAVVVFFPVMINTTRGLVEVDPGELELMRSLAAPPRRVMAKVRVPNALPYFFSAMKVATTLSIIAAVVAEYFGGPQDVLGQYIISKANLLVFPDAWAAILVASILGIVLYALVLVTERLVMPWHASFRSGDT
jgi:NitT/TauT family transport system permease protein